MFSLDAPISPEFVPPAQDHEEIHLLHSRHLYYLMFSEDATEGPLAASLNKVY
ncbi:MAG: hypothetical protein MUO40_10580 [Anaerolineaceae bacterium]|nr:hypothetical protein [Anaerolineaceae bacterium]